MKYSKVALTLSLSLACIIGAPFAAYGEGQAQGVILGNNVNIRQAPQIDSQVLDQLGTGEEVEVLSNENNWYLIETDSNVQGWILNDLIAVDEEKDLIKKGLITANSLNVRKEPSINSSIVHTLSKETEVTIIDMQDIWYQIAISETQNGWIHKDYVQIKSNYSKGKIIGNSVNLRKEKSVSSEILDNLSFETYIYVKDYSEGWYNILTFNGQEGWIHKDYVSIVLGNNTGTTISRSTNRTSLKIVQEGKKLLGIPYVYGANGPNSFDCSGFTSYVFKRAGIKLPRTSKLQATVGTKVSKSSLQVGDLVFFDTSGANNGVISHVGIYIGNGQFIHASSGKSAKKVVISKINTGFYNEKFVTARRVY